MLRTVLNKILKEPAGNIFIQIFRYMVSGGTAFAVDFVLLYLLTDMLHLHYLLSSVFGFMAGLVITYLFSILWIFDSRRFDNRIHEFLIFSFIGLAGLCLTEGFMYLFTAAAGLHYLFSKIVTAAIVSFASFAMKKLILFSKKDTAPKIKKE